MVQFAALLVFNFIFFWQPYVNPYILATSELLSTFYPSWIWQGRQIRARKSWKFEPNYWLNFHSHPVLSSYYPPHVVTAWAASFLSLDAAFALLVRVILLHYLWMSIGWYLLMAQWFSPAVALFAAVTFTYQACHIRQQPCVVYTLSWFPWVLYASHGPFPWLSILTPVAIGMMLLSGYFPVAVYLLPLAIVLHPTWWMMLSVAIGAIIASPQLVPFFRYIPKTIRSFMPAKVSTPAWESKFYFGLTPVMLINPKHFAILLLVAVLYIGRNALPRVPLRSAILVAYAFIWFSVCRLAELKNTQILVICLIQYLDLWLHNCSLIPTRPFCELYQKPSRAFNTNLTRYLDKHLGTDRVSGLPFPLFTGLINNFKTLGYCGGMQLKLMAKWRNDTDPNGSGHHDWFKSNEDSEKLDVSRVKFAFTRAKLDWVRTGEHCLYANPRLQTR